MDVISPCFLYKLNRYVRSMAILDEENWPSMRQWQIQNLFKGGGTAGVHMRKFLTTPTNTIEPQP